MKLYLVHTQTRLSPFGDDVSAAQVMRETLAETQERAARRLGLELVRVKSTAEAVERPCLLATDSLYFSERALSGFWSACRANPGRGATLALPRCASVEHTLPLQDLKLVDWEGKQAAALYDLWLVPSGPLPESFSELRAALAERCPPLVVPVKEQVVPIRLPTLAEGEKVLRFALTATVCCHISHWTHLLWLTNLSLGVAATEYYRHHRLRSLLKVAWAVIRGGSLNRYKIFSRLNVIGKGCDIHPTAYLEASMLGRGVKVGAGACVRNSLIGDDVILGDHAVVINSVVGRGCFLTENFFLVSSLCYPGSTLGCVKLQMAVIGRDVYLHGWCAMLDAKFIGDVKVSHRGQTVGTGRSFMASCVGHRAVLGAKILVHPGREIPNDLLLVSRPEDVIAEIPPDLPPRTPMVRDQGTLVPLASLKPKGNP